MTVFTYSLAIVLGYLIGSIPVGYLMGRLRGKDIRRWGSGRTGATNVLRSAGVVAAGFTLVGDVLKGLAVVLIARYLLHDPWGEALAALAGVIGHGHSVFLNFQGGAGVIVFLGMLLVWAPPLTLVVALIGIAILLGTRYASLGSIVVCALVPVGLLVEFLAFGEHPAYLVYGLVVASLIIYRHRPNIRRLLAGTERRLGEPAKPLK